MKRILVNLVSEQTTPNFLFIKEMLQENDELLFISSEKFKNQIDWILKAVNETDCIINKIILPDGIEEDWTFMISLINQNLFKDNKYIVNLTCGTKYMSSAVQKVFENFNAEFYYIPFPKNIILKFGDKIVKEISYRMSIKEFFDCNNTPIPKHKNITKSEEYTRSFFNLFTNSKVSYDVIEKIRIGYRNKTVKITDIETKENEEKKPQIPDLSKFLSKIDFTQQEKEYLNKNETEYLTGGWFEEYIFSLIIEKISPQNILLGVELPITENNQISRRDLDIVFTFENKLFVIECKTGIDREYMFNETVYKAAALKNERLGKLSANTLIFSLAGENNNFKEIAKAMNIQYFDRTYFTEEEKESFIFSYINKKAKG